MAKKAERKLREEQERRASGVPARSDVKAPPPAAASGKAAKKALRATRPAPAPSGVSEPSAD
jgi:hypothetical protein